MVDEILDKLFKIQYATNAKHITPLLLEYFTVRSEKKLSDEQALDYMLKKYNGKQD